MYNQCVIRTLFYTQNHLPKAMFKKYKYVCALLIMWLFLTVMTTASSTDVNQTNNVDLSTNNDVIVDTVSTNENDEYISLGDSMGSLDDKCCNEIYVNGSIAENEDGSKNNPFKDMKSAINKSKNRNTIYIPLGLCSGLSNKNLTIMNSLNILNWTTGDVIFDGKNQDSGLRFDNPSGGELITAIYGLTFKKFTFDMVVIC